MEPSTSATTASESTARSKSAGRRTRPAASFSGRPEPAGAPGGSISSCPAGSVPPGAASFTLGATGRAGLSPGPVAMTSGLPAVTPGIHLGALRSRRILRPVATTCLPSGGRWSLRPSARMLRPSIFRLVLILRHDANARAPQHAGDVGIRAGFRGPLELVARRQVCGLDHVAG